MIRVGFSGVPGAGKTSLARTVAAACRRIPGLNNVELIAEYARRYITKHKSIDEIWEQYRILKKQIEWEDAASKDIDILFTDSPIYLCFVYGHCLALNGKKDLMVLNDLFSKISKLNYPSRYDIIFHIPPREEIKPVNDGVRGEYQFDDNWRIEFDKKLFAATYFFPPNKLVTIETVGLEQRENECIEHLKEYLNV